MNPISSPLKTRVRRSKITDKWLAEILKNGQWRTISPHCDRDDAVHAIECIKRQFQNLTQKGFDELGIEEYTLAIASLDYPDDDEPLCEMTISSTGKATLDFRTKTLLDMRSLWSEHDLLSDAVRKRGTWIKRAKSRGFG